MKGRIISIGNSKGIRIPKVLIEQTGLRGEVEIVARGNGLLLKPARQPREGWEEAFQEMARNGDDALLDSETLTTSSWDVEEWEW